MRALLPGLSLSHAPLAFVGRCGFAPFAWQRITLGVAILAVFLMAAPT